MKKILITGVNSYIGNSFETWIQQNYKGYIIDKISLKNDDWKSKDFSVYDSIVHVAGIAHVSKDPKLEELYYKVNTHLTESIAKKAKKENVKQFIFLSSIIVYGNSGKINEKKVITKNTKPEPSDFYGDSKLQAENKILPLNDEKFNVAIIRPPMIYGKGSKGNYPRLAKLAKKIPVFPNIHNERSMLHIDNLCEFIRLIIENQDNGIYYPQNKEFVSTTELVKLISKVHGKNIKVTKIFNPLLMLISNFIGIVNKVFGNLSYDMNMSEYKDEYRIMSLKESIINTEK